MVKGALYPCKVCVRCTVVVHRHVCKLCTAMMHCDVSDKVLNTTVVDAPDNSTASQGMRKAAERDLSRMKLKADQAREWPKCVPQEWQNNPEL